MPVDGLSSSDFKLKTIYPSKGTSEQESPTEFVIVKKNDTLWNIVKTIYGGSQKQIKETVKVIGENNNIDPDKIFPRQKIKLLSDNQFATIYPDLIDVD